MNIAFVTETFPPDINGVAFTLQRFAEGLLANGHQVRIHRPRAADSIDTLAISHFNQQLLGALPVPGYVGLRMGIPATFNLRKAWQQDRPDVIYIATEGPLGWAAMRVAKQLNIPFGSGYHTNFCDYLPSYGGKFLVKLAAKYQRWFHNQCHFTAAPSLDTVARLLSSGYERVHQIGRGVDAQRFSPLKCQAILRASWGAKPGDFVVLIVGRVAVEKNLPLAFEAAAQLITAHPRMKLVIVGDGPMLTAYRSKYSFAKFAGEQRGDDLAAHYASADLLLFPSLTETFGNVLLEAMASGLPTLSFDYAASRTHIREEDNGWKVPYGNSAAFIAAFAQILEASPYLLDSIGSSARRTALELTWAKIVTRFENLLEQTRSHPLRASVRAALNLITPPSSQSL
jgi:glycosyltransferase involved in cell wall biosynthesis